MKEPFISFKVNDFFHLKKSFPIIKLTTLLLFIICLQSEAISSSMAQLQQQKITGTVSDATNNEPLVGASIIIEGTTTGTITDANGKYSLEVSGQNAFLIISYLGYLSEKTSVTGKTIVDMSLIPDVKKLDEVVVVGYGTMLKKDLTGAAAKISGKDLNQGPISNPLQQIAGKAAGVNVTQVGSEPGSGLSVRIRGITSLIGGNDPLVVVDGIQGNMDLLNQLSPSEIESFDILKDASATAIYGSRGAPGVILITTKKSKAGKFTVEYNGTSSIDAIANKLKMMSADEWRTQRAAWNVPVSTDHGSNTDWYNLLTKTGSTQNHTLAFGGGSDNFNYRISGGAILQDGVVLNSNNNKYLGRITATQKAFDNKLTLTMNLNSEIENARNSPGGVGRAGYFSNTISNAYEARPTDPALNPDGSFFFDKSVFQYINPYAVAKTVTNEVQTNNLFGSFRADYELTKGLTAGWFGSMRKVDRYTGYYAPYISTLDAARTANGLANIATNLQTERLQDISLNYKKSIGSHNFDGIVVYEWQNQLYQGNFVQERNFPADITTYNALQFGSSAPAFINGGDRSSYKNDRTLVSYLGRINYGFMDRYLLTVSLRRDGSSVFGSNNKWGNFPSVAIAWKINEESFMSNVKVISTLKLRGGYGVTGNQQGLGPQNSLQLVGSSGQVYFNGGQITNYGVTQNANPDLKWETRYQSNIGIDFGLFDNRLTGTVDAYDATTKNLLFNYNVPTPPYPYTTMVANVGSISNKGIEVTLNYQVIKTKDMTLNLGGNVSFLQNKVLELSGNLNGISLNSDTVSWGNFTNNLGAPIYLIKGQPVGTFNIIRHDGIDAAGAETVVDRNGDGKIDTGDKSPDRFNEGSALPKYTFSFTPNFTYKNFDISMVWRGSGGNKIYNFINQHYSFFETLGKSNLLESATAKGLFTSKYGSDLWLEDGSFIRFENLTMGYRFETKNLKYISGLRISFTANNLALITKYTGLDPEINVNGANGFGTDGGMYPRTRTFAIGLNVIFK